MTQILLYTVAFQEFSSQSVMVHGIIHTDSGKHHVSFRVDTSPQLPIKLSEPLSLDKISRGSIHSGSQQTQVMIAPIAVYWQKMKTNHMLETLLSVLEILADFGGLFKYKESQVSS